jgi:glycosyltransferase involved in cell wall biosynthesis
MEVSKGLLSQEEFAREKHRELEVYTKAHTVIVVSSEEAEVLKQEGIANTAIVTNIVPVVHRDYGKRRSPLAVFVGGFGHAPNIDAVKWFLEAVWTNVLREIPNGEIKIAGPGMPPDLEKLTVESTNAEYVGYLPSLMDFLDLAAVSVAPLTYGGGVKGKVNEAMAHGLPLVTTHVGIQGIPATHEVDCLIADDPTAFAAHIVRLFKSVDLQVKLGKNAQILAEKTCSRDRAIHQLGDLFGSLERQHRLSRRSLVGKWPLWIRYIQFLFLSFLKRVKRRIVQLLRKCHCH